MRHSRWISNTKMQNAVLKFRTFMTKPGSKAISSPQSPHHRRLPPTSPSPALGRARCGAATADPVTAGGRESSPWLWAGRWAGGEGPCSPALCSHPSSGANSSDPAAGAADPGWRTRLSKPLWLTPSSYSFLFCWFCFCWTLIQPAVWLHEEGRGNSEPERQRAALLTVKPHTLLPLLISTLEKNHFAHRSEMSL